jgi:glycosyltransferase involved in cell wall biosynthesis
VNTPPQDALLVDARAAFGSGLGRYLREMVRALAAREEFAEIVLAGDPDELRPFVDAQGETRTPLRVIPLRLGRYAWSLPLRWPAVARAVGRPHVTWFPHWDGAWRTPRAVTTIHDLIAFDGTGPRGFARRVVAREWMTRMVRGSAALITVSEGAAARIRSAFPEAAPQLQVVPNGVAQVFFEVSAAAAPGATPYLLTVANKKAHKNLAMAIRVLAHQPSLRLVMVGERFAHAAELHKLARQLEVFDRVSDVTGLSDAELATMYAGAEALLVPSREEGFGMVALEAMACGTPVVAVDRAPLPEVVGEAGIVVPFDDDAAMSAAVTRLREDPAERARRVVAGRARAAEFTWARAAARTAAILKGV